MSAGRRANARGVKIVADRLEKHGRALGLDALARLMKKTPVDTGQAKGNWFVGIGDAVRRTDEDRRDGQATAEGTRVVQRWDPTKDPLHITNTVPYIERLEDGHSQIQAPQGMARLTVMELQAVSDRIAVRLNRG